MRRAGKTDSKGVLITLALLVALALSALALREWQHLRTQSRFQDELNGLQAELAASRSNLGGKLAELENLQRELEESAIALSSSRDRSSNLEAQRDHLRAELDQRSTRLREMGRNLESVEADFNRTRLALLEAQQLPTELQNQLTAAQSRITELEDSIDGQTADLMTVPRIHVLEGVSSDETIFALSGSLPETSTLPASVYLCSTNGLILEGWLAKIENNLLLGHVEHWRTAASALVKGEKVFILPRIGHEEDI